MYALLLLSFFALLAGPVLIELTARQRLTWRFLDAFVLFSIVGIVVFRVLPHSIEEGGILAIMASIVGLVSPLIFSKISNKTTWISIASFGLITHALLDGFALATLGNTSALLGFAIVLHRFPEGLGIWRLASMKSNKKHAALAILGIALSTLAGFFFGDELLSYIGESSLVVFESLMAGILLHVVFHRHIDLHDHQETPCTKLKWGTGVGAFCGFFLVIILSILPSDQHAHAEEAGALCCHKEIHHHDHKP